MQANRVERTAFLFVIILMFGVFAAGQFGGGITSSAAKEAWDFEDDVFLSDYWDTIKLSVGDDLMNMIIAFIGVFAILSMASASVLAASQGGYGGEDTAKGAMSVFSAAGAFITAYYYSEVIIAYLLLIIPIIIVLATARYLKHARDEASGGWSLVVTGFALIACGGFLLFGNMSGDALKLISSAKWLSGIGGICLFIGILILLKGIHSLYKEWKGTDTGSLGGGGLLGGGGTTPAARLEAEEEGEATGEIQAARGAVVAEQAEAQAGQALTSAVQGLTSAINAAPEALGSAVEGALEQIDIAEKEIKKSISIWRRIGGWFKGLFKRSRDKSGKGAGAEGETQSTQKATRLARIRARLKEAKNKLKGYRKNKIRKIVLEVIGELKVDKLAVEKEERTSGWLRTRFLQLGGWFRSKGAALKGVVAREKAEKERAGVLSKATEGVRMGMVKNVGRAYRDIKIIYGELLALEKDLSKKFKFEGSNKKFKGREESIERFIRTELKEIKIIAVELKKFRGGKFKFKTRKDFEKAYNFIMLTDKYSYYAFRRFKAAENSSVRGIGSTSFLANFIRNDPNAKVAYAKIIELHRYIVELKREMQRMGKLVFEITQLPDQGAGNIRKKIMPAGTKRSVIKV